jgi:hypothetical protein
VAGGGPRWGRCLGAASGTAWRNTWRRLARRRLTGSFGRGRHFAHFGAYEKLTTPANEKLTTRGR